MIEASASSGAAVERLWAVISEVTAWPRHLRTFTSVVPAGGPVGGPVGEPIGPGARFEVRQPGLPRATYEVSEWVPGSHFVWVARSPGVVTTARHAVVGQADGSRVELAVEWDGPLAPVVRAVLGRRTRSMVEHEASTLARVAAERG